MINKDVFYGRVPLYDGDIETLYEVASLGKTYVEIGTLFGASACIAGLAGCDVYCIDPLDGYNIRGAPDPHGDAIPSPKIVWLNWTKQGLDLSRLHIHASYHPPWPREIDFRFDIGLVDGNHGSPHVWLDFNAMNERVNKYLLMHDTHLKTVGPIFEAAKKMYQWEEYIPETKKKRTMRVLRRV